MATTERELKWAAARVNSALGLPVQWDGEPPVGCPGGIKIRSGSNTAVQSWDGSVTFFVGTRGECATFLRGMLDGIELPDRISHRAGE